jgi:hypothetical protein
LAYGTPCKPPCWQGLTLGKTTSREAKQVVEELLADQQIENVIEYPETLIVSTVSGPDYHGNVGINFEDDVVTRIMGSVDFYYPLEALVQQFGLPERVYEPGGGESRSSACKDWEPPQPVAAGYSDPLHLLYPSQGLYFAMLNNIGGYMCPEMRIIAFCYYEPVSLSRALKDNYLADMCGIVALKDVTEEDVFEWYGFNEGD